MSPEALVREYRRAAARAEIRRAALLRVEAARRGLLALLDDPVPAER